jgi:hypothetical protein
MSEVWHGGKGSSRRKGADQKKFNENWDAIFGKKEEKKEWEAELDKKQWEDVKEEK